LLAAARRVALGLEAAPFLAAADRAAFGREAAPFLAAEERDRELAGFLLEDPLLRLPPLEVRLR
jgi:hypothetical protein